MALLWLWCHPNNNPGSSKGGARVLTTAPELKALDTKTFLHICRIVVDEQLAIWVLKLSNFFLVWSFWRSLVMLERFICYCAGFCSNISLAEGRYSFQIVEMSLSICSGLLSRMRPLLPIPPAVDQVGPSHNSYWKSLVPNNVNWNQWLT